MREFCVIELPVGHVNKDTCFMSTDRAKWVVWAKKKDNKPVGHLDAVCVYFLRRKRGF